MGLEVLMALVESELFPNVTDWPLCSSKHAPEKAWVSLGISSVSLASTVSLHKPGLARNVLLGGWMVQAGKGGSRGSAQGHREWRCSPVVTLNL